MKILLISIFVILIILVTICMIYYFTYYKKCRVNCKDKNIIKDPNIKLTKELGTTIEDESQFIRDGENIDDNICKITTYSNKDKSNISHEWNVKYDKDLFCNWNAVGIVYKDKDGKEVFKDFKQVAKEIKALLLL